MATFAVKDGNTTDIDPELLTVNLLGPEPDPEDLVITPQNVKAAGSDQTADIYADNSFDTSAENSVDNESIDKILEAQKPAPEAIPDDEAEITAVEDMLRSKKSARIKKQKADILPADPQKAPSKHRIDPIVIVSAVVAAALIFVFAAYFMGLFDGSNSLKMTLTEFSDAYSKTAAYKAITKYGFVFPEATYSDETEGSDATPAATEVRSFSASVDNTVNYPVLISGTVNRSDSNIKNLQVEMWLSSPSAFKDALIVFIPYLQVLYPDMSTQDATTYLTGLYTGEGQATIKGNYGTAVETSSTGDYFSWRLIIMSAGDAKKYNSDAAAASSSAAGTEDTVSAAAASETSAVSSETTAVS